LFVRKPHPLILAVASGALSALSIVFPVLFFFIWAAFTPLFVSLKAQPAGKRLLLGFTTGLTYFGGAYHWVWWSSIQFFAFPPLVGFALFLCFLVWNGFIFALFAVAFRPQSSTAAHLFFTAMLWVVLERYFPALVPWQFGAILQPHLAAIQLAEVTGGAGLSFFILFVNGLLLHAYEQRRRRTAWGLPMAAAIGVVLTLDVYGRWRLSQLETESPVHTLSIAIVQGNAPPMRETTEEAFWRSLQTYSHLSLTAATQKPALIVWPELAVRTTLRMDNTVLDALFTLAEQGGTPLLVGALDHTQRGEALNSAFLVSPAGEFFGVYHKTRLFPFAEFLPWPFHLFARWWPAPSFVAGDDTHALLLPDARFAASICYEAMFPGFFRQALNNGAEFLVHLTNDVWLGNTNGPWQHLQAAVIRAVESRRWLVRAANSGVSAVIAPSGRIVVRTELFTTTTLQGRIALRQDDTLYTRWGDWFVFVCLGSVCLLAIYHLWSASRLKLE
jgi:apolipoprotein N-acyltransferase